METANRRATIQKISGIPGYANGGPVSPWSIKGIANTVKGAFTESPEAAKIRRDKEYADQKAAVAARQPATTQQSAPQAPKAITSYAGGLSTAQKLADIEGKADGGPITGPGGPTDDQVPIMASPGEFVIKASAAKKIGIGALEALNSLGDEKAGAAKAKKQGKFYGGGDIKREELISQIPTGGNGGGPTPQPDPSQSASSTELGRNVSNAFNAVAPLAGGAQFVNAASRLGSALGSSPAVGRVAQAASNVAPYAVPAAAGTALIAASSPDQAQANPVQPQAAKALETPPAIPAAAPAVPTPTGPQQGIYKPTGPAPLAADAPGMAGIQARQDSGDQAYAQKRGYDAQVAEAQAINADGRKLNLEYDVRNSTAGARKAALALLSGDREAAAGKQQAETNKRIGDQNNQLARDQLANTTSSTKLDNESKSQILTAQKQLQSAKTDEERSAALDNLQALQGRYAKEAPADQYAYAPGGQTTDANGQVITQPGVIYNKATGETKQQGQAKTLPPQTAHIAALKANPKLAADFDAKFGPGAAAKALAQK